MRPALPPRLGEESLHLQEEPPGLAMAFRWEGPFARVLVWDALHALPLAVDKGLSPSVPPAAIRLEAAGHAIVPLGVVAYRR